MVESVKSAGFSATGTAPSWNVPILTLMGRLGVGQEWLAAIAAWEVFMRAAGRPESTIYLRTYHVRRLAAEHVGRSPWEITLDDLTHWLGLRRWSVETLRAYRASVRSFYAHAVLAGQIAVSPAALLPPVRPHRCRPRPAPEAILQSAIIGATERERLMILLGAFAGLRRAEIAQVHTRDVVEDSGGPCLRVRGKGGHVRIVPLSGALAHDLRSVPPGWLFPNQQGGHLTPAHVGKLISRRLPDGWSAHTLRHRFATRMRARGVQIDVIKELLGHARVETTLIYSELPSDALRQAILAAA
jgi:integrase/recombinase XerC